MIPYTKTTSRNGDIQALDSNVDDVFGSIFGNPLLNSPTIIEDLVFTSGTDLVINHKLNRRVKGYIIVKASAAANLYTSSTTLINPTAQIILKTDATATLSILFF